MDIMILHKHQVTIFNTPVSMCNSDVTLCGGQNSWWFNVHSIQGPLSKICDSQATRFLLK